MVAGRKTVGNAGKAGMQVVVGAACPEEPPVQMGQVAVAGVVWEKNKPGSVWGKNVKVAVRRAEKSQKRCGQCETSSVAAVRAANGVQVATRSKVAVKQNVQSVNRTGQNCKTASRNVWWRRKRPVR